MNYPKFLFMLANKNLSMSNDIKENIQTLIYTFKIIVIQTKLIP